MTSNFYMSSLPITFPKRVVSLQHIFNNFCDVDDDRREIARMGGTERSVSTTDLISFVYIVRHLFLKVGTYVPQLQCWQQSVAKKTPSRYSGYDGNFYTVIYQLWSYLSPIFQILDYISYQQIVALSEKSRVLEIVEEDSRKFRKYI